MCVSIHPSLERFHKEGIEFEHNNGHTFVERYTGKDRLPGYSAGIFKLVWDAYVFD
jgi:hypothetical protein